MGTFIYSTGVKENVPGTTVWTNIAWESYLTEIYKARVNCLNNLLSTLQLCY